MLRTTIDQKHLCLRVCIYSIRNWSIAALWCCCCCGHSSAPKRGPVRFITCWKMRRALQSNCTHLPLDPDESALAKSALVATRIFEGFVFGATFDWGLVAGAADWRLRFCKALACLSAHSSVPGFCIVEASFDPETTRSRQKNRNRPATTIVLQQGRQPGSSNILLAVTIL